jgi:hypothetical protein
VEAWAKPDPSADRGGTEVAEDLCRSAGKVAAELLQVGDRQEGDVARQ